MRQREGIEPVMNRELWCDMVAHGRLYQRGKAKAPRTHRVEPWHVTRAEPETREIRCASSVRARAVNRPLGEAGWRIGIGCPIRARTRVTPD